MDDRKTDQMALVLLNVSETNNGLASNSSEGEYQYISVVAPFKSASYDLIKNLQEAVPWENLKMGRGRTQWMRLLSLLIFY